ncbi:MAG: PrsW family intramembrane metalloprotease [Planctomycetes bacterium]|nr:PrsW family intramembrane metalloprotease [Planctomycetota bacterium]
MLRLFRWLGWDDPRMTYGGLAKLAAGVFLVFAAAAYAWTRARPPGDVRARVTVLAATDGFADAERWLAEYLEENPGDGEGWRFLVEMRGLARLLVKVVGEDEDFAGDFEGHFTEEEFLAFLDRSTAVRPAVLRAWYVCHQDGLEAGLAMLASVEAAPLIEEARMRREGGDVRGALDAYERVLAADPGSDEARLAILELLVEEGNFVEARRRLDDPRYLGAASDAVLVDVYVARGKYLAMIPPLVREDLAGMRPLTLVAALVAGAAWFLLALHLGWSWKWPVRARVLAPAALVLGFVSATACLPVVVIQDDLMGDIGPHTSIAFNLLYCLAGIGLREELVKLLFVLPLAPFLVRMKDDLAVLSIASLVGLGFAINENAGYYAASLGDAVFGRFLTASFAHMALTGYAGYWLVRALKKGGAEWAAFGSEAAKMVTLHGVYDFLLIEPRLDDVSFLAMAVFIWLSQAYLRLAASRSPRTRRPVPLTRLFVASLAVAAGAGYVLAADVLGMWQGLRAIAYGVVGEAVIAIMFFREFGETVGSGR